MKPSLNIKQQKNKQLSLFKRNELSYGGELLQTRKGRLSARPLATKSSMHLVLRSSLAKGEWAMNKPQHRKNIEAIVSKFANKYGVKLISLANVGNHLHFHLKMFKRRGYRPFIRAITAAIAMTVTGVSRWKTKESLGIKKFWDYRPFTRIITGFRDFIGVKDYIKINELEGQGYHRAEAKFYIKFVESS